jgi:hypothetical protein
VLFHYQDQWGQIIAFGDDRWTNHILVNHAELAGQQDAVGMAVVNPSAVIRDQRHANGLNYYAFGVLAPPLDRVYLKVCVRIEPVAYSSVANGLVITAYPISAIKKTEVQIWP